MTAIHRLDLIISNAYLVGDGRRRVLVDTGASFAYERLRDRLDAHDVEPGDIALVILTHAHPDHAGNAARLKRDFGAPVAIHAREAHWLRTGTTELYRPCGAFAHVLDRLLPRRYDACEPDRIVDGDETRETIDAVDTLSLVHTPGHTPGHLCVETTDGGLCAGDLLRGGMLRGDSVAGPLFVADPCALRESVARVVARAPRRLHFGHGKEASGGALARADPIVA